MDKQIIIASLGKLYNAKVDEFIASRFNDLREEAKRIVDEVKELLCQDKIIIEDEVIEAAEVEKFLKLIYNIISGDLDKNFNIGNINYFLLYRWSKFEELFEAYQDTNLIDKVDVVAILNI